MTALVKCPTCGIKTGDYRAICPRCEAPLEGAPILEHSTRRAPDHDRVNAHDEDTAASLGPEQAPDAEEREAPAAPVFDEDISSLFPERRRFGGVDFLLLAGLIGWLALFSDVKLWLDGGLATFGMNTAEVGALRAVLATGVHAAEATDMDAAEDAVAAPEPERRTIRASTVAPEPDAPEAPPPPATTSLQTGNRLFDAGRFDAARAQFETALAAEPDHPQAHNNLGQTLVRLGQHVDAVEHLEEATRLDPASWAYRFNLAKTLAELGWWHRAVAEYRQAATMFPDDYVTQYNLGRAQHEWGDYRAAAESYLRAIALAPEESRFYLSLATTYESMARPADAAEAYGRYLSKEPDADERDAIEARIASLRAAGADATAGP